MHETLTILTDVRGVCQSVCLSRRLNRRRRMQCTLRAVRARSFGAAFVKCLLPLVRQDFQNYPLCSERKTQVLKHGIAYTYSSVAVCTVCGLSASCVSL